MGFGNPLFICCLAVKKDEIITEIEQTLAEEMPDVEVVDIDVAGSGTKRMLRVFIDHPQGVDHELCAKVTSLLRSYLKDHTVEVSSPGVERRLRKPEHFRAAVGKQINLRTFSPVEGQRNFTGFLISLDDEKLRLKLDEKEVSIPFSDIARAQTVFDFGQ